MDTPTQALLGAVVGQAVFGRKLGRHAAWWGAVGGAIPDLDVIPSAILAPIEPMAQWLYHRGPSHAVLFALVLGPLLGWLVHRYYRWKLARVEGGSGPPGRAAPPGRPELLAPWMGLLTLSILSHPILDWFTVYGTQLWWPFTDARFALNAVAVIDPTYSVILIAALIAGSVLRRRRPELVRWAGVAALVVSSGYLFYGLSLNRAAEAEARQRLAAEGQAVESLRSYPTLLQPYLRRVVAQTPDEVRVGYLSTWTMGPIEWERFDVPEPDARIETVRATREGRIFDWFSMGQGLASVEEGPGGTATVELMDLRYGMPRQPQPGFWGIRAELDARGELTEPPQIYRRPFDRRGEAFGDMIRSVFGSEPEQTSARAEPPSSR